MLSIPIMLVGNKSDEDETLMEVSTNYCEALAQKWKCSFMETQAKNNMNVEVLRKIALYGNAGVYEAYGP